MKTSSLILHEDCTFSMYSAVVFPLNKTFSYKNPKYISLKNDAVIKVIYEHDLLISYINDIHRIYIQFLT